MMVIGIISVTEAESQAVTTQLIANILKKYTINDIKTVMDKKTSEIIISCFHLL